MYDVVVNGVLDSLHAVIQQFGKVLLGLALLIFNLLVHQNLEALQLIIPLDTELVAIFADELNSSVDLLFKLLEQVFVLKLYIIFDLSQCFLKIMSQFLNHSLVVLLLNYQVLLQIIIN